MFVYGVKCNRCGFASAEGWANTIPHGWLGIQVSAHAEIQHICPKCLAELKLPAEGFSLVPLTSDQLQEREQGMEPPKQGVVPDYGPR